VTKTYGSFVDSARNSPKDRDTRLRDNTKGS
jgi:hypothetical protein